MTYSSHYQRGSRQPRRRRVVYPLGRGRFYRSRGAEPAHLEVTVEREQEGAKTGRSVEFEPE